MGRAGREDFGVVRVASHPVLGGTMAPVWEIDNGNEEEEVWREGRGEGAPGAADGRVVPGESEGGGSDRSG